ncbi:MAG TPA: pilus assembly PilX N-terminal domain-containing protein, partial [Patescibacteria group bacterium]|nr:pilus assembly PilX N-terminal domain-containing protein [Patescibacteria group bacterium]
MKNPQPTTHNLQPRNKNGSILVFSLLILSVVTIASIGVATVTVVSRKAAGTTGKSAAAFQMADTGLERTLQGMYNALTPDYTLADLAGELGSECSEDNQGGGVIDVQTA